MAIHKTSESTADIENRFTYHRPGQHHAEVTFPTIRNHAKELANVIDALCPPSREKSLALTKLQEAVMWANASVVCNPEPVAVQVGFGGGGQVADKNWPQATADEPCL